MLQENNLKEALRTVGLLEARIEELMNELVKRQHRHSDVQGVWESSWVARDWEGSGPMKLWKPVAGVRDARFVSRWSCTCNPMTPIRILRAVFIYLLCCCCVQAASVPTHIHIFVDQSAAVKILFLIDSVKACHGKNNRKVTFCY